MWKRFNRSLVRAGVWRGFWFCPKTLQTAERSRTFFEKGTFIFCTRLWYAPNPGWNEIWLEAPVYIWGCFKSSLLLFAPFLCPLAPFCILVFAHSFPLICVFLHLTAFRTIVRRLNSPTRQQLWLDLVLTSFYLLFSLVNSLGQRGRGKQILCLREGQLKENQTCTKSWLLFCVACTPLFPKGNLPFSSTGTPCFANWRPSNWCMFDSLWASTRHLVVGGGLYQTHCPSPHVGVKTGLGVPNGRTMPMLVGMCFPCWSFNYHYTQKDYQNNSGTILSIFWGYFFAPKLFIVSEVIYI